MTDVQAGWYPDPHRLAPYRWWDGERWTTAISQDAGSTQHPPMEPAKPAAANSINAIPEGATINAGTTHLRADPQFVSGPLGKSSWRENQLTIWSIGASVFAAVLTIGAHLWFIVVTPFVLASASWRKGERFAALAYGVALVALATVFFVRSIRHVV